MKRILITGANSYIGTSFEAYIKEKDPDDYIVDTVDMMDGRWRERSFAGYDSVFHVAGIAHSDRGRIDEEKAGQYYAVNTDLAIETAQKAKADGVGQFVFMSSAIVYGAAAPIGTPKRITKDTPTAPENCYGDSKVRAEAGLRLLDDEAFRVVILRPPMIYGKGSKGNYPLLARVALRTPLFPYVKSERSMLYIDHLCEFVRLMIENGERGTFWPQNETYSNTSELVQAIAAAHGKRVRLVKGFSWALRLMSPLTGLVNKAFGNLSYDLSLSAYTERYCRYDLAQSIKETEAER